MASMNFCQEDFERLQASILELKNQNYQLDDENRKQKRALDDLRTHSSALEQDLVKAQKAVQKSKKAVEVQSMMQENIAMQRKMQAQEEDFRLQNQTLLQELSKLVTTNEQLETEIRSLHSPDSKSEPSMTSQIISLKENNENLTKQKEVLAAESQRLKETIEKLKEDNAQLVSSRQSSGRISPETVKLSGERVGVSFRKQSQDYDDLEPSKDNLSQLKSENSNLVHQMQEMQQILNKSQGQNEKLILDLRTKQEELNVIQRDKNAHINKLNDKISELGSGSSSESSMKTENESLQAQLQRGYTVYNEFKEKKAVEINELQTKLDQVEKKYAEWFSPEAFAKAQADLESLRVQVEELQTSKLKLEEELDLKNKLVQDLTAEKEQITLEMKTIQETCDKRKRLLDEMAVTMQEKSEKSQAQIKEMEEKIEGLEEETKTTTQALKDTKSEIEDMGASNKSLCDEKTALTSELEEIKSNLEALTSKCDQEIEAIKESHKDEIRIFESEKQLIIRDLKMQLEISNAERSEFEEKCQTLKDEVRDALEERKIGEKKGAALIKDLKKQLKAEKIRNEKLQEKMKEVAFTEVCTSSSPLYDVDPDRTSISSWSMMSGGGPHTHEHGTSTPIPPSNMSSNGESLPKDSPSPTRISDNALLLEKIGQLQEQHHKNEEKISMLEQSASSMAEDLLRKATLIQFYCMEGGKAVPTTPTTPTGGNSDKRQQFMKKMVTILSHPDGEARAEMQRVQNMLEETLTKNMHLQRDLENMAQEVVRLSKLAAPSD